MKGKFDFAKLQNQLGKYKYVAIILCLGVVLMLWPTRKMCIRDRVYGSFSEPKS